MLSFIEATLPKDSDIFGLVLHVVVVCSVLFCRGILCILSRLFVSVLALLALHIFCLDCLSLFFQLPLALERINLLFNIARGLFNVRMVHHVSSAETLFDLVKLKGDARSELMQSESHLSRCLFVLEVGRKLNF